MSRSLKKMARMYRKAVGWDYIKDKGRGHILSDDGRSIVVDPDSNKAAYIRFKNFWRNYKVV